VVGRREKAKRVGREKVAGLTHEAMEDVFVQNHNREKEIKKK
jgi:hypothetical protein